MTIDAMRLVAPAFAFGLSYAVIVQNGGLSTRVARSTLNKGNYLGSGRLRRRAGPAITRSGPRQRMALGGAASDSR